MPLEFVESELHIKSAVYPVQKVTAGGNNSDKNAMIPRTGNFTLPHGPASIAAGQTTDPNTTAAFAIAGINTKPWPWQTPYRRSFYLIVLLLLAIVVLLIILIILAVFLSICKYIATMPRHSRARDAARVVFAQAAPGNALHARFFFSLLRLCLY